MVTGFRPDTLEKALKIRKNHKTTIIAGGTDLMVQKARGTGLKPKFQEKSLFISHLEEISGCDRSGTVISIGACTTLSELLDNGNLPKPLAAAIEGIASIPLRNIATIGGNICNASPAGDTLPFLYAAEAELILKSSKGPRRLAIQEFITGPGEIDLRSDEILTRILIPNVEYDENYYKKVGTSKGMALAKLSVIGLVNLKKDKITEFKVALGAIGPTVIRSPELEKKLVGKTLKQIADLIPEIKSEYSKLISPIDDSRSTKEYRHEICLRILDDFLSQISQNEDNSKMNGINSKQEDHI